MPMSSRNAFFVFLLAASIFATLLPACGRGPLVCTGGARVVGSACYCAKGQTWNGSQCAGTPETGACAQKNSMEVVGAAGSICYCPDGWIWDSANRTECLPCTGGAIANGDSNCYCPDGTAWNNNACEPIPQAAPVASCMGGAIATDQGCMCPQGATWNGAQCMCPAGAEWNGAQCVWQQQPQQQVIQQRSIQSSSSFTCCVNHAKYNCPNDAAFQACATMQGNHGCARAGGC
ncbi:MAG: hypothetical protein JWM74_2957 [Myxococcaceae bacterium]|nr:hypothetical protein [Myxococcaceae bacterium]